MPKDTPLVFGIGLPHSGGRQLSVAFIQSGYDWQHHAAGKLAQSLSYARATQTQPLAQWPDAIGFSGFFYTHKRHLPPLNMQDYLAFLYTSFPNAYFINTHRDPVDWITARYLADDGQNRIASAWHTKLGEADLLDHWLTEQEMHAQICGQLFDGNPRYLDFNITTQPLDIVNKFLPHLSLAQNAVLADRDVPASDIDRVVTLASKAAPRVNIPPIDMSFTQQVIEYCVQKDDQNGNPKALNRHAIHWTESKKVHDKSDQPAPIAYDATLNAFVLAPDFGPFERAQATLNELAEHGATPPLWIDMMDARFSGMPDTPPAPRRTITYNRRIGAKGLTLWPLPGYHTLAPTGLPAGFPPDTIPFEDKGDRCVWLGNMTGRMSPVLTSSCDLRGVYAIRKDMEGSKPDWDQIIADLDCVPRYHTVKTLRDHPDFHVGLVLRDKWRRFAKTPAFKGLADSKRGRTWFHRFRYILSLSGNDTGSNFLSAAASNALILKEEDGWELFYTDAFKPWVHYVPLAEGAVDIEEKLAWARAHPQESASMARAATELYDKFANPNNRAAILRGIARKISEP